MQLMVLNQNPLTHTQPKTKNPIKVHDGFKQSTLASFDIVDFIKSLSKSRC